MFKLIQLLAAFVVRQYENEAKRLHKVVAKVDAKRDTLTLQVDELANELAAEVKALEAKFAMRRGELVAELTKHDEAIDGHVNAAAAATLRANALAKVVK